jgi:hypothetical protein
VSSNLSVGRVREESTGTLLGMGRGAQRGASDFTKCILTISISDSVLDLLCGLVVTVVDYIYGGPGSIPGTTRKK